MSAENYVSAATIEAWVNGNAFPHPMPTYHGEPLRVRLPMRRPDMLMPKRVESVFMLFTAERAEVDQLDALWWRYVGVEIVRAVR